LSALDIGSKGEIRMETKNIKRLFHWSSVKDSLLLPLLF